MTVICLLQLVLNHDQSIAGFGDDVDCERPNSPLGFHELHIEMKSCP